MQFFIFWSVLGIVAASSEDVGSPRHASPVRKEVRPTAAAAMELALQKVKATARAPTGLPKWQQHRMEAEQVEYYARRSPLKNANEAKELEEMLEQVRDGRVNISSLLSNQTNYVEEEAAKFWSDKAAVEVERNALVEKLDTMQKELKAENDQLGLQKQGLEEQLVANNLTLNTNRLQYQQEKDDLTNQFKQIRQELNLTRVNMRQDIQELKGQLDAAKAVNGQLLLNLNALTEAKVELEAKRDMQESGAVKQGQQKMTSDMEKKLNVVRYQRNDTVAALVALCVVAIAVPCFLWKKDDVSVRLSTLSLASASAPQTAAPAPAPAPVQAGFRSR